MKIILNDEETALYKNEPDNGGVGAALDRLKTFALAGTAVEIISEKCFKKRLLDKISTDPKLLADLTDSVIFGEVFDSVSR